MFFICSFWFWEIWALMQKLRRSLCSGTLWWITATTTICSPLLGRMLRPTVSTTRLTGPPVDFPTASTSLMLLVMFLSYIYIYIYNIFLIHFNCWNCVCKDAYAMCMEKILHLLACKITFLSSGFR